MRSLSLGSVLFHHTFAQTATVASARRVDEMMQEILQMPTAPTLHGVKTRAVTALQTFAKRLRDYEDPQVKEEDKRQRMGCCAAAVVSVA